MSTIPIQSLLASPELRKDRGFNSLFASYATSRRKPCGRCRRRTDSLTVCKTLLSNLIRSKRELLGTVFNISPEASLSVYVNGKDIGIRVK